MTGYISVPSSWNKLEVNDEHSGYGYATFRLQFNTSKDKKLALKIPRIFTAYNLWINGELIASAGKVGKSKEVMVPQYLPQIGLFETQEEKNEIVIQVANFHHRSGGILESIELGGEKQILDLRYKTLAREFIVFGSLTCMPSRYGGEEFIVIFPETDKEEAIRIADLIRQKIETLKIAHGQSSVSSYVTVSIGVTCTIPNNNISADDLFKVADKALYQAKDEGRNRVKFLLIQ